MFTRAREAKLGDKTLMTFTEKFKAKYAKKPQNLPIIEQEKPVLSDCYSCERFEQGPDLCGNVRKINWCVTKYFDRIKKRPVTCYRNIELMDRCSKKIDRK